jgi:hypothetical protein
MRKAAPTKQDYSSDKNINASAFQEHLASSLGLPGAARSRRVVQSKKANVISTVPLNKFLIGVPLNEAQKLEQQLAERWTCEVCKETNGTEALLCLYCKTQKAKAIHTSSSAPLTLTLAQSRGLVEMPRATLNIAEWNGVEARFAQRNDTRCAICLEFFGLRETLLSHCSHAFHAICLQNLSRFLFQTTGGTPSCPVCRSSPLQIMSTRLPAATYVSRCVTKFQAVHRGRLQRRLYFQLRKSKYIGKAAGSNRRQAAFLAEALGDLNKALTNQVNASDRARESLLSNIDENVEAARKILQGVDKRSAASSSVSAHVFASSGSNSTVKNGVMIGASSSGSIITANTASLDARRIAQERSDEHRASAALRLLDILSERLQLVTARQRRLQTMRLQLSREYERQQDISARRAEASVSGKELDNINTSPPPVKDWNVVREVSFKMALEDCAVCLVQLEGSVTTLISCGHVFHVACLNSYESFVKKGGSQGSQPRCVLCRQLYLREDYR